MSDVAIRVERLGKRYRIGQPVRYKTLRDGLAGMTSRTWRGLTSLVRRPRHELTKSTADHHIWALKDVSFEVKRGEVVGVIGRNGAGKSTLLKILSRITEPTTGYADVFGRVGSLLEVGTGFHPELTGRENIYLNAAILGMRRAEIAKRFDEIVAFAELERFLDTPIKHYSNGMYVRLAFAVAAHFEPDILLVDEVLAVGDAAFQARCMGRMGEIARSQRTVLFVSHSMAAITSLCENAILLEGGCIRQIGTAKKIAEEYMTLHTNHNAWCDLRNYKNRRGTGEIRIIEASILDQSGKPRSVFNYGEDICFEFVLERVEAVAEVICVIWIRTVTGVPVLHLASHDDPSFRAVRVKERVKVRCIVRNCALYPGIYIVSVWNGPSHRQDTDFVIDALQFRMEQGDLLRRGFEMDWRLGIFYSDSRWSSEGR